MSSEEILSSLIRTQSKAHLQNSFMRLTDREVAVSLRFLDEADQESVLSLLPPMKAQRVREEKRLLRGRIRVPREKYEQIIGHVIAAVQGKVRGNVSSYLKPRKKEI